MSGWRVVVRPEAGDDIERAAAWYDRQSDGLGSEFAKEVLALLDSLAVNPLLGTRRHPVKNIR
jgi:plasmid stabilization system protein ParE